MTNTASLNMDVEPISSLLAVFHQINEQFVMLSKHNIVSADIVTKMIHVESQLHYLPLIKCSRQVNSSTIETLQVVKNLIQKSFNKPMTTKKESDSNVNYNDPSICLSELESQPTAKQSAECDRRRIVADSSQVGLPKLRGNGSPTHNLLPPHKYGLNSVKNRNIINSMKSQKNPLNKHGVPSSCKECGSTFHYIKNCPDKKVHYLNLPWISDELTSETFGSVTFIRRCVTYCMW